MSRAAVSPTTEHLRFTVRALDPPCYQPEARQAFSRILLHCAASSVWTYSPPSEPCVEDDDEVLARIAGVSASKWKNIKSQALVLFDLVDGKWFPKDGLFQVIGGGTLRPIVPASIRSAVMKRDRFTCGYCGNTEGPFDLDHIIPIAQGGDPVSEDNLLCACATCNRRKGALRPEEWVR